MTRQAQVARKTRETDVEVELNLDGGLKIRRHLRREQMEKLKPQNQLWSMKEQEGRQNRGHEAKTWSGIKRVSDLVGRALSPRTISGDDDGAT